MALRWEDIGRGPLAANQPTRMFRASMPDGWLIAITGNQEASIVFYPDPQHDWKAQENSRFISK